MIPRIDGLDRNFLMNSGFDYFQRALSSASISPSLDYVTADRWLIRDVNSFNSELSERSTLSPDNKTKHSFKLTVNPTNSTDKLQVAQRIESIFSRGMVGGIISGGLKYHTDGAKRVRVILSTANVEDDFSAVTEFYNQTFVMTDNSTWNESIFENITPSVGCVRGVQVLFEFDDWTTTSGNNILHIAQPKLSIGTKAQNFSYFGRDLVEELSYCQRYFESTDDGSGGWGDGFGSTSPIYEKTFTVATFKVEKRVIPVMSYPTVESGAMGFYTQSVTRFGESGTYIGGVGRRYTWEADAEL